MSDRRPLRDELEDLMLFEASASPLAQAMWQEGADAVEGDGAAHLVLLYKALEGVKQAVLRLADEVDALRSEPAE